MAKTPYEIRKAVYKNNELNLYVSTTGQVFDEYMNEKTYHHDNRGYKKVCHLGQSYFIHRLVAETFIPNPNNLPTVNHKVGDKEKNGVDDLEWMSFADNNKHALSFGLRIPLSCDKHQYATMSDEQVHEICKMLEYGVLYDDIIKNLNLQGDKQEIRRRLIMIKNGYAWTKISSQYNIPKDRNSGFDKYTEQQIRGICELMQSGEQDWRKIVEAVGLEATSATRKLTSVIRCGGEHARADIISEYNIPPYNKRKYTEEEIRYICYLLQSDAKITIDNVLILAGIDINASTRNTIKNIRNRKTYTEISKDYKW